MPNTNYLTVPKNMQRVLFLSALLCLMTHVIPKKIKVTENTGKNFRVYDTEKNDYTTKNTGQLDFSQGKWIYFADSHRLEFHSKFSGFLDFSGLGSRFYKSMYLDTPKRVLVFPLAPRRNAANKLYPFVGRSMLLFGKPDQNQDTIFDTMFSDTLSEAFNSSVIIDVVGEANLQSIVDNWNFFPYLDPQLPSMHMGNSFSNYWGVLVDFGKIVLNTMKTPNPDFSDQEAEIIQINKYQLFKRFLNKVATIIYFEDIGAIDVTEDQEKKALMHIKLKSLLDPMLDHLAENSEPFKQKMDEYVDVLFELVYPVSEKMMNIYLNEKMDKYLTYFFIYPEIKGIDSHYAERVQTSQNYIYDFVGLNLFGDVLVHIADQAKNIKNIRTEDIGSYQEVSAAMEDAKKSFEKFTKIFMTEQYETIKAYIDEKDDNSFADLNEFVAQHKEVKKFYSQFKSEFAFDRKNEIQDKNDLIQKFQTKDWDLFFTTYMAMDGLSQVLLRYEFRSWGSTMKSWEFFSKMSMDIFPDSSSSPSTVDWFRQLLVMVGQMDTFTERDDQFIKYDSIKIFDIENRLVLI